MANELKSAEAHPQTQAAKTESSRLLQIKIQRARDLVTLTTIFGEEAVSLPSQHPFLTALFSTQPGHALAENITADARFNRPIQTLIENGLLEETGGGIVLEPLFGAFVKEELAPLLARSPAVVEEEKDGGPPTTVDSLPQLMQEAILLVGLENVFSRTGLSPFSHALLNTLLTPNPATPLKGHALLHILLTSNPATPLEGIDKQFDKQFRNSKHWKEWFIDNGLLRNEGARLFLTPAFYRLIQSKLLPLARHRANKLGEAKILFVKAGYAEADLDKMEDTALLFEAAKIAHQQPKLLNLLLDAGIDINTVNKEGYTALHVAVVAQNHAAIQVLIQTGANINAQSSKKNNPKPPYKDGATPLGLAVNSGNLSTTALLLDNHADIHKARNEKRTPILQIAAERNDIKMLELLLSRGVHTTPEGGEMAKHLAGKALNESNQDMLYTFLNHGVNIRASERLVYKLETLAEKGSSVSRNGINGELAKIQLLLKLGASTHTKDHAGKTALYYAWYIATRNGNEDGVWDNPVIIDLFLQHDATPEELNMFEHNATLKERHMFEFEKFANNAHHIGPSLRALIAQYKSQAAESKQDDGAPLLFNTTNTSATHNITPPKSSTSPFIQAPLKNSLPRLLKEARYLIALKRIFGEAQLSSPTNHPLLHALCTTGKAVPLAKVIVSNNAYTKQIEKLIQHHMLKKDDSGQTWINPVLVGLIQEKLLPAVGVTIPKPLYGRFLGGSPSAAGAGAGAATASTTSASSSATSSAAKKECCVM